MTIKLSEIEVGDTVYFTDGNFAVVIDNNGKALEFDRDVAMDISSSYPDTYVFYREDGAVTGVNPADGNHIVRIAKATGSEQALRHNDGKPPMAYLPLDLLEGASKVMEYGSKKYTKGNYRKGYKELTSPLSSLIRHVASLQQAVEADDTHGDLGFLLDGESGESHVHHVVTSALLLIHSMKLKGWKV